MKQPITIILLLLSLGLSAQSDSLNFELFQKYSQINMGFSYVNFTGEVSNFTKQGGSLDMYFASGRRKYIYGFNMNVFLTNKVQEFSIPPGYEHYNNPATALLGLFYGQTFGDPHSSHFQAIVGLEYGWLLHKKLDEKIGGYHGIIPKVEFSRSFRIGKSKYSDYQYTSQFTPMKYDPSISDRFIDIFIGYRHLLLNHFEGKGGVLFIGIRYKLNKYSIRSNTVE